MLIPSIQSLLSQELFHQASS